MKIVHIIPGSGNTFYCQNCMRDNSLVTTMINMGHDVTAIPMYLPLFIDDNEFNHDIPVFYGAINTYLKQVMPAYRKAPVWLERFFDNSMFLKMAAKMSGSTDAAGLEDMTLSMLRGEDGNQSTELDHLVNWLKHHAKPDIVHLSNALLLGLAGRIKSELNVPVFCSLQDEHQWVDPMRKEFHQQVWDLMAEKGKHVDAFVSVSQYYLERMRDIMRIPDEKLHLVYLGHNLEGYVPTELPFNPPAIGYLSRFSSDLGLDILADAYIQLKQKPEYDKLQLDICGGNTTDDKKFFTEIQAKFSDNDCWKDVRVYEKFDKQHRLEFFKNITVLSVPVPGGEAFGSYLIEAFASAVPVVQPDVGAFKEVVDLAEGGIVYTPNSPQALAESLNKILQNRDFAVTLGRQGHKVAHQRFKIEQMAANMVELYQTLLN